MERTLTLDDLREFEQYPGLAVDRKAHFSRFANKTIVHRDYHRNYTLMTYILLFFIFAFIGWIWEVGIHIVEDGVFVNRGTMFGPWLPIYGFGGVCGIILLKRFIDHHVATFFLVVGLCSVVEYVTSWYLETFKHMKYWDYTGYFCNINGRICLEGALIFGFAGCAGIYIMAPFFDDLLKKIPFKARFAACVILVVLFCCDAVYSKANPNQGKGITDYAAYNLPFHRVMLVRSWVLGVRNYYCYTLIFSDRFDMIFRRAVFDRLFSVWKFCRGWRPRCPKFGRLLNPVLSAQHSTYCFKMLNGVTFATRYVYTKL